MKKDILTVLLLLLILLVSAAQADTVTIAGKEYDTSLETLDLSRTAIPDVNKLEEALCAMPNLTYVDLSSTGLSNEVLAALRERMAERGVKIVWTVRFDTYTVRTDATAFSTLHSTGDRRLGQAVLRVLSYCTDLKALDLGHNYITDASFLEPLTQLRVLILSDNRIKDLSVLAGKPLQYLEAFNNGLTDISWLEDCETLIDLNLCLNHITDLSPLYQLPNLKRVYISSYKANEPSKAAIDEFLSWQQENLEAWNFTSQYPTLYGWREDSHGIGHPRYEIVKAMFKEGVYYDFNYVLREDQYVHLFKDK